MLEEGTDWMAYCGACCAVAATGVAFTFDSLSLAPLADGACGTDGCLKTCILAGKEYKRYCLQCCVAREAGTETCSVAGAVTDASEYSIKEVMAEPPPKKKKN